jgi:CBS domain-containing protein
MSTGTPILKDARRLTVYIGESDRWRNKPLYMAILEALKVEGIAGATVVRGVAGFGAHSRIRTAAILRLSEDLPLRIEVIDSAGYIDKALDVITPMVREGLITVEDVEVIRYTHRGLNPLPADKPIRDVMTEEVVTLEPEMTVSQAWELMLERLIKAMPVVDHNRCVIGMLTDEDLIRRAGLQQHLSVAARLEQDLLDEQLELLRTSTLKVADVMTKPAITAHVDEPLGTVAARMAKHEIKRLPIVDDSGRLVGVVARVDIIRQVMDLHPRLSKLPPPDTTDLTLKRVMNAEAPTVLQDANLETIVAALVETGLRRLIVVDTENRPIGLISDSDVVTRIQPRQRRGVMAALRGEGTPSSNIKARDLMSPGVLTAGPDTPLVETARKMLSQHRKWLVVVDEEGRTMGLVDRQVLLKALTAG